MLEFNEYLIEVYGKKENVLKFGRILKGESPNITSFQENFLTELDLESDQEDNVFLCTFKKVVMGDIMEPLHAGEISEVFYSIMKNPLKLEGDYITLESYEKLIKEIGISFSNQKKLEEEYFFQRKLEKNEGSSGDNLFSIASDRSSIVAEILRLSEDLQLKVNITSIESRESPKIREILFENGLILKHTLENLKANLEEENRHLEQQHNICTFCLDEKKSH